MSSPGQVRIDRIRSAVRGLAEFLIEYPDFELDETCERFLVPILTTAGFDCDRVDTYVERTEPVVKKATVWQLGMVPTCETRCLAYRGGSLVNEPASRWLEHLLFHVEIVASQGVENLEDGILAYVNHTRTHPLQINRQGETLVFYHLSTAKNQENFNLWSGTTKLESGQMVGTHQYCQGNIHFRRVAQHRTVLSCPDCQLRIVLPHGFSWYATYGQLREYFFLKYPDQKIAY